MDLRINAASPAIARSLTAIATLAGARIAPDAELTLTHEGNAITLRRGAAVLQRATAPVRPAQLARLLAAADAASLPPLASGWQFDPSARHLTRAGVAHTLTEKEALLLHRLLAAHPAACPRDALLKEVWGMQSDVETHTLETHIYRLRQKLGELTPKPCDILTVDSAYRLTMETA